MTTPSRPTATEARLRIVSVAPRYPLGGAEQVAMQLVEGMEARHDLTFITAGERDGEFPEGGHRRITLALPPRAMFWHHYANRALVQKLREQLARIRPDIVHFHNLSARTFSASALLLSRDWPAVWSLHDLWSRCIWSTARPWACDGLFRRCLWCSAMPGLSIVNRLLKERVFRKADVDVIVPCRWLKDRLARSALGQKRMHVIPNGVPLDRFGRGNGLRVRSKLGVAPEDRVVIFAGHMGDNRKGCDDLLTMAHAICAASDRTWFLFVGSQGERASAHPRILFTGAVPHEEMADYYAAADVLAYPTHADILPMVVLEAMASGLPAVCYDVGGTAEEVADGETGFVLVDGDEAGFEAKLRLLLEDDALRRSMGGAARRRAEEEFTVERQVRRTEEVYEAVIRDRRQKGR